MPGVIILAAGESKRLGQPKQNLLFRGKTLLQNAIDAALNSVCSPIIVVLGAHADSIIINPGQKLTVLNNPHWQEGMASSIRLAVTELIKHDITGAIMMLCDQPFADTALLNKLVDKQNSTGKAIIACSYHGTLGVPVLFKKTLFPALLQLHGRDGAKKIFPANAEDIALVAFEKGAVDIDTITDYGGLAGL